MFTKEEQANLEVIFAIARQARANDEKALIDIINFKAELFKAHGFKETEEVTKTEKIVKGEGVTN